MGILSRLSGGLGIDVCAWPLETAVFQRLCRKQSLCSALTSGNHPV